MVTMTTFKNHLLEVGLTQKPSGDYGTPNAHKHWIILFYHVWGPQWIENSLKRHLVEGPVTYDFTLTLQDPWLHCMIWEVSWHGLRTLSFGLLQFHGHGSWLVCEVVLSLEGPNDVKCRKTMYCRAHIIVINSLFIRTYSISLHVALKTSSNLCTQGHCIYIYIYKQQHLGLRTLIRAHFCSQLTYAVQFCFT
jgi:hypothetical protein